MRERSITVRLPKRSLRIVGIVALYVIGVLAVIAGPLWFGWPRQTRSREMMAQEIKRAMADGAKEVELRVGSAMFALVRVPPGEFEMGSPSSEDGHMPDEAPVRKIRLSKPFYLGRFEVTQFQYKEVTGETPLCMRKGESLPVDSMHYEEALEFCEKLSQRTGLLITLPTEAQWEYACRAGTRTRYHSGDTEADLDRVGWYRENAGETSHPVGQKKPNAWGLYDMHGNVWEPCIDQLPDREKLQGTDPRGTTTTRHTLGVMRGGGWMHPADYCRAAISLTSNPMFGGMGIRIAINADAWDE